jgi:hypothetical protein
LELTVARIWSDVERDFISTTAHILLDAEIAAALARILGQPFTRAAVCHVRKQLGLKKWLGRPRRT